MARQIEHVERGPAVFDADDLGDDGELYICRCGLSDTGALCDGSHNATAAEADGVLYKYDGDDSTEKRRVVESVELAEE